MRFNAFSILMLLIISNNVSSNQYSKTYYHIECPEISSHSSWMKPTNETWVSKPSYPHSGKTSEELCDKRLKDHRNLYHKGAIVGNCVKKVTGSK